MKNINEDISFLKDFVERRQTYIRFSPLGTAITGIMIIIYYFFGKQITEFLLLGNDIYLFLVIGIFGLILVTVLSLVNSKKRGEQLLPKSVKYIIVNLIFFGVTFLLVITPIFFIFGDIIITSSISNNYIEEGLFFINSTFTYILLLFYGLLIIVSRFCIPEYIKYFGLLCFILGVIGFLFSIYFFSIRELKILIPYYNEIILIFFGIGHLVMAYFLKNTNDKK